MKGFCVSCHVLYEWQGRPALADAYCPRCGLDLSQARTRILEKYTPTQQQPAAKRSA